MSLPLDSDMLRTFLAVAEAENITRAAETVGRTQSAVSMQLRKLEHSVGDTLFTRGPRGVELTRQGTQLLPYARNIVGLLDEASLTLRSRPLNGPVRIGIPEEYGPKVLPRALASFAQRHAGVEVTVRSESSDRSLAALDRNELDLALVFQPAGSKQEDILAVDPTVWAVSIGHPLERKNPVPVAVLNESRWCAEFAIRSLKQHGIAYRIAYTSDSISGLISVASAGLAVASLSRSTIPGDCRELTSLDGFPQIDSSCVVLRRNPRSASPVIDALVRTIRDTFSPASA